MSLAMPDTFLLEPPDLTNASFGLTVDTLRSNFQELYHIAHNPASNRHSLIPDLSGTHIYDSNHGSGLFLNCFYKCINSFTKWDFVHTKLKQSINYTQKIFLKELALMEPFLLSYQTYLKRAGNGYAVVEAEYSHARKAISTWNASTQKFIKLINTLPKDNIVLVILKQTLTDANPEAQQRPLFQTPITSALNSCQKIIDLEGMTKGSLPLEVIKKLLKKKPLSTSDQKSIDSWSKKVQHISADKVQLVHRCLQTIASLYLQPDQQSSEKGDAAPIEALLEKTGCTLFQQKDPTHISWRDQLEAGTSIPYKDTKIILGTEINPLPTPGDKTRVFEVKDHPDIVALVARNQAELSIRRLLQATKNDFGIPLANIVEIFHDGRVAFMERLQSLGAFKWTSSNGILSQEDAPVVNALAALLQEFINNKFTPSNFKPTAILLNSQYQLRTLKPMTKRSFDFNALEEFVTKCAGENRTVFKHLMTASGLSTHSTATFYYDIISTAFKGEEMDASTLAAIYDSSDPKVVDRGEVLVEEALPLWRELCTELRTFFPLRKKQELNQEVGKALIECHKASKAAGKLGPSLYQDVIAKIKATAVAGLVH